MLTLLLLRHAKSDWTNDLSDHERPLSKRGVKAAPLIARYIVKNHLIPDRIICSDAIRTRATLSLMLPELPTPPPAVDIDERLYLAPAGTILEVLRETAPKANKCLMVVGHNPGIHALAVSLVGGGDKKGLASMAMKYPTAALAAINFDCENWNEVKPATGELEAFVVPRQFS